jgi:hypothetical protein
MFRVCGSSEASVACSGNEIEEQPDVSFIRDFDESGAIFDSVAKDRDRGEFPGSRDGSYRIRVTL